MVPVADGRRRLRRRRLPRHRAAVRHARGGRGADRARPTSSACGCMLDIVPNHTSDQHAWFQAALAAGPGSPERERYVFRPGPRRRTATSRRTTGRACSADRPGAGHRARRHAGEWYLHLFAPEQPDLNWEHPEVRADFEETLRFWFDRGVDGFRIDVAHSLVKEPGLPDAADMEWPRQPVEVDGDLRRSPWQPHPFWDRDEVHEVYRGLARGSPTPTTRHGCSSAEAWVDEPERLARYLRADELHTAFNFAYLRAAVGRAATCGTRPPRRLDELDAVGRPGHLGAVQPRRDPARRRATPGTGRRPAAASTQLLGRPADLALGGRRARAAALLTLGAARRRLRLPGRGARPARGRGPARRTCSQDPTWERSGHTDRGRDGCRVPMPWSGTEPPYGFSPDGAERGAVAAAARGLGAAHRRGRDRRPGLDARAVPRRAAAAPRDAGLRRRLADLARPARGGRSGSRASPGWPAS